MYLSIFVLCRRTCNKSFATTFEFIIYDFSYTCNLYLLTYPAGVHIDELIVTIIQSPDIQRISDCSIVPIADRLESRNDGNEGYAKGGAP